MKTNLLDKQLYNANFQVVGKQLIAWKDARPDNKTFDNLIKCVTEMYFYTNNLEMRNITLDTLLDKQRDENFKLREKLQALTR
jgi:hypothetical protein